MSNKKDKTMKRILTLALLFQVILIASFASGDDNDYIGHLSDLEFNSSKTAIFVNDVFIKSEIGLDLKTSMSDITKEMCKDPLVINGFSYTDKITFHCDKNIKFVSLDEVRKEYCPNVNGSCLFMINKFFISKDVVSYKIEKNFIKKVELLASTDIEIFKGQAPFTIIRIFTNTENNQYPMRLQ